MLLSPWCSTTYQIANYRVTGDSATIIDHVVTNDIKRSLEPGVIQTQDISDQAGKNCNCN